MITCGTCHTRLTVATQELLDKPLDAWEEAEEFILRHRNVYISVPNEGPVHLIFVNWCLDARERANG